MPEVDGFAATKLIREREKAAAQPIHIPIIALTANAIKGDRELCLAAGMDAYVTKPIEPMELFKAIGEALGPNRRVRGAGIAAAAQTAGRQTPDVQTPILQTPSAQTLAGQTSAQPAAEQSPPIDFESLSKRCLGNRALAVKALEKFVGSLDTYVEDLSSKLRNPDLSGAAAAHKLKGAAANLSAEQVRRLAADMETLIKGRSIDQAEISFNQLRTELDRLREYVATSLKDAASRSERSPAQGKSNG
jgi:Amt family ammonium transporter